MKCSVCPSKSHGKSGYCLAHLPEILRCTHTTNKGRRCKLPIIPDSNVCKVHLSTMRRGYGKGNYGWVYVFDTGFIKEDRTAIKIVRSVNPQFRIQELIQGNPFGKFLFYGFVGSDAKRMEAHLHRQYENHWIEREMFWLSNDDLKVIEEIIHSQSSQWFNA